MSAYLLKRFCAFGLAALLAAGCASAPVDQAEQHSSPAVAAENHGIQVEALRLSAAGYMLDLRYRITDPDRATPFLDRKSEAYLLDPVSGARLAIPNTPKLGRLRQVAHRDMTDRSYFMLFANPGRFLKSGQKVSLVIGEVKLENILIQ